MLVPAPMNGSMSEFLSNIYTSELVVKCLSFNFSQQVLAKTAENSFKCTINSTLKGLGFQKMLRASPVKTITRVGHSELLTSFETFGLFKKSSHKLIFKINQYIDILIQPCAHQEMIFVCAALLILLHTDQTTHHVFQEYLASWSKGLSAQLEQPGNQSPWNLNTRTWE